MSAQQKPPFDFKTQYGLGFNPQDNEIVVDFFLVETVAPGQGKQRAWRP
ncbi:hypothetical protein WLF14_18605 [Pseudomonas fluorescens]|jgi:hypothetical protein|nr:MULTISPECIES: hypothetical protein [Pseudomonas]MDR6577562.1 hypothetical protein [Pseudomonas extremaustralis]WEX19287.1 hypothetical protein P2T68_14765 [Pseudomonas sp. G11]